MTTLNTINNRFRKSFPQLETIHAEREKLNEALELNLHKLRKFEELCLEYVSNNLLGSVDGGLKKDHDEGQEYRMTSTTYEVLVDKVRIGRLVKRVNWNGRPGPDDSVRWEAHLVDQDQPVTKFAKTKRDAIKELIASSLAPFN
tara:strand:+ start:3041 stop:3472 length:432 start_codon:yes stop_codon:yes gene_type:complete